MCTEVPEGIGGFRQSDAWYPLVPIVPSMVARLSQLSLAVKTLSVVFFILGSLERKLSCVHV